MTTNCLEPLLWMGPASDFAILAIKRGDSPSTGRLVWRRCGNLPGRKILEIAVWAHLDLGLLLTEHGGGFSQQVESG